VTLFLVDEAGMPLGRASLYTSLIFLSNMCATLTLTHMCATLTLTHMCATLTLTHMCATLTLTRTLT
jgi:hypothetical protein